MDKAAPQKFDPWTPGITSAIPKRYLPLATIYRPENVATSLEDAAELADFIGLPMHEMVAFRPERLIVHEVLIRVMADISVPDGKVYEDLGINFRRMAGIILSKYVAPKRADIVRVFSAACESASKLFHAELKVISQQPVVAPQAPKSTGWLGRLLGRNYLSSAARGPVSIDDHLTRWASRSVAAGPLEAAAYAALARTVSTIIGKRGRLMGGDELISQLALREFSNTHGSKIIGDQVGPIVEDAARNEGFKLLPAQEKPSILNVKGASAAGKSTLRPLQRKLVERLGLDWSDFALISPDIFRKYLLDYDSLDEAARYAGSLSGHEIEIVDLKLDAYMAAKAARGDMPHLLIDRFRFDSFSSQSDADAGGRLLTRFGDVVHMFFMITPPADTVERAWHRGEQVGRYKAVDDLLFHNIEAFSGMPNLFFTWALREGKQVHYEFLDNSVKKGERPRTVAFGVNGELNIMDIGQMLNVDRYKRVNVDAASRDEVFPGGDEMSAARNGGFLQDCFRKLKAVRLAEQASGKVYAWVEQGTAVAVNHCVLKRALKNPDTRNAFAAILPSLIEDAEGLEQRNETLDVHDIHTLGAWGVRQ